MTYNSAVTDPGSVDLHCHSTASDGTERPAEVVRLAHEAGLSGLALTDHDTVAGVAEAAREAERLGLDFLPGIELSCSFPRPGTMHLLGYGVDPDSPSLRKLIDEQTRAREARNRLIVERLNGLGLDVSWDEVLEEAGGGGGNSNTPVGTIGRPHLAAVLVRKGHVVSARQAFDRYLGGAGGAYVDTNRLSPERAIATVRAAGGVASLAHPMLLRRQTPGQLEAMVRELAEQGLEAIETIHSGHDADTVARLTRLADRLELLTTGGSDFHGTTKPGIRIGRPAGREVPREFFDGITCRLVGRRPAVRSRKRPAAAVAALSISLR
jgi:predicted metal-dependent phosphoesterase TrpH